MMGLNDGIIEQMGPMGDWGHMDWWNWWGIPYMGIMMVGISILFIVIAVIVYKDANNRGMNGALWAILVIIPMIGIIFLVIYVVLRNGNSFQSTGLREQKSPKVILDERYARGEITEAEYNKKKKDLGN